MNNASKELVDLIRRELSRRFPRSEIRILEDDQGALKVSVGGIKVFDWTRIQQYLTELPLPKKQL